MNNHSPPFSIFRSLSQAARCLGLHWFRKGCELSSRKHAMRTGPRWLWTIHSNAWNRLIYLSGKMLSMGLSKQTPTFRAVRNDNRLRFQLEVWNDCSPNVFIVDSAIMFSLTCRLLGITPRRNLSYARASRKKNKTPYPTATMSIHNRCVRDDAKLAPIGLARAWQNYFHDRPQWRQTNQNVLMWPVSDNQGADAGARMKRTSPRS